MLTLEFVLLCLSSGFFAVAFLLILGEVSADLVRFFLLR